MPKKIDEPQGDLKTEMAVMKRDIKYLTEKVEEISLKLDNKYVTQEEFKAKLDPMSKIVYGMVALMLTAIVGGVMSVILK